MLLAARRDFLTPESGSAQVGSRGPQRRLPASCRACPATSRPGARANGRVPRPLMSPTIFLRRGGGEEWDLEAMGLGSQALLTVP